MYFLNIIIILVGLIHLYIISHELFNDIQRKYGVETKRNVYYAIFLFLLLCILILDFLIVKTPTSYILVSGMILCYLTDKIFDNKAVNLYKNLQIELDTFVNSGWGKVYKANELRGKLSNLWIRIPEIRKQEILTWEKEHE